MSHSLMYLTQLDPHDGNARRKSGPLTGRDLRAYIALHALFFDQLLVGDSQFLTNERLRALIWPGERGAPADPPADMDVLLDHKVLLPAIRSTAGTLRDVWTDLSKRHVEDIAAEDYISYVEEHLASRPRLRYDAAAVSALFRQQVLATLSAQNGDLHLLRSVREATYNFAAEQQPLLFAGLRRWMDEQVASGRMTARQKSLIDRAVATAYRHNVPKAIKGSLADVPLDPADFWTPIDIQLGRKTAARGAGLSEAAIRPFALSPRILGSLPAETLLAIRADPARRPLSRNLADFRRTGSIDIQQLAGQLETYLYAAEQLAYSSVQGELREAIRRRRRSGTATMITVTRDVGLAAAGLGLWRMAGPAAGLAATAASYTGLVVIAHGSLRTLRHHRDAHHHGYAAGRLIPDDQHLLLSHREQ
jgi:hypothetical protein